MLKMQRAAATFLLGLVVPGSATVTAQTYPNKPIRVVAAEAGGAGDLVARTVAQGLAAGLGQQVIVDNHGGSVGIPGQAAARAAPDGYTLLAISSTIWLVPLMQDVPYDPITSFAPITLVGRSPNIVVAHPSLPVKSVAELIALARAQPGAINYSSGIRGSMPQLAAELFKAMTGVNLVYIPYKGAGPAIKDLIGGQIQLMFTAAASAMTHVRSGRLRALAITSAQPSLVAPGLPTVAAAGLPGYEAVSLYGLFAPAGTPAQIISRLNTEAVATVNRPEVKDRLFKSGIEAAGTTPEAFAAAIKTEMTRFGKVIRDAGLR